MATAALFKRVEAGLHKANVGVRSYELRAVAPAVASSGWALNELTGGETRLIGNCIATLKEGEKALRFSLDVNEKMEILGAAEKSRGQWVLQTRLGPLNIRAGADHVFMRFDDVEKAEGAFGPREHFNRYSGKWNMRWKRGTSNWRMLLDFSRRLDRVTLKEA